MGESENMEKSWESMEKSWKNMEKSWESMEKSWENMGESTGIQGPVFDHPRYRSFLETNDLGVPHFGRTHFSGFDPATEGSKIV